MVILDVEVVATGMSIQETMPASVSNPMGPVWSESAETMPLPEVYSKAPLSTVSPPKKVEVAAVAAAPLRPVLMRKMGAAVVEVAMDQAKGVLFGMVEVAAAR